MKKEIEVMQFVESPAKCKLVLRPLYIIKKMFVQL